jgi:acetyl esterase
VRTSRPSDTRPRTGRAIMLAVLRYLGGLLVVALALLVAGAFFPDIAGIGVIGSVSSGFSTWIGVATLVALAVTVFLIVRRRTLARILVAAVAALTLVGATTITVQLVATGQANGVMINPFAGMPSSRTPDEVAVYGEHDGEDLEVSIWSPSGDVTDAPIAFITHGGGWVEGAPTDDWGGMIPQLTAAGWLVVSAGYTLATPSLHTADIAESQIACAMAWTAQNAATYGADPTKFVSLGDSAGGNLAINTSYRSNSGELSCDEIGPLPRIAATATLFPAVDPYSLYNDTASGTHPGRTFLDRYIGGSPEQYPDLYESVDSSTHISTDAPPTLILQGQNDHLVQAHGAREFADAADSAGLDVTLVVVPFGEHVFQFAPLGAELYTKVTLKWLESQGIIA